MRNGCLPQIIAIIIAILAALALWWWFFLREPLPLPDARSDDAGDYSFVRQIVPLIQGRKVRGRDEIRVLADLIAATDRATLVDLITSGNPLYRDEYIEHWADLIVDWMRVNRETAKAQTECFGAPAMATADSRLARYIRDNPAFAGPGDAGFSLGGSPVDFNMSDVLRSSLALDNLAPAYLGYLFPLVDKPIAGNEIIEQNRRADLGAAFVSVYTNRQMTCLGCHTSTTSASGPETYWNRHYPIFGNFEKAIYGFDTGRDSREVEALLRHQGFVGGATRPWGMEDCGGFDSPSQVVDDTLTHPDTGEPLEAYFVEPIGRRGSVWDLERSLRDGFYTLQTDGLRRGPDPDVASACEFCETSCVDGMEAPDPAQAMRESEVQSIVTERCVTCHLNAHDSWSGSNWKEAWIDGSLVVPGDADMSRVVERLESSTSRMPPAYATGSTPGGTPLSDPLSAGQISTVRAWIDGLVGSGGSCDVCPALACQENRVDGDAAFAYLVANNIVSNAWSEVFGPKLTIANSFPRTSGQGSALWNLTENEFIPGQWSLQRILTRMLTSELFNRQPPETSTGSYAYELALAFDPWVEGDPRSPPRALPGWDPSTGTRPERDPAFTSDIDENRALLYNAMTEAAHRYRPRSLLYSVHRALGWDEAPRFSSVNPYPSDELRKSIGQFWRDAEPGFNEVDFQGLLNWESVHGRCDNPGTDDDWIDALIEEIRSHNDANPGSAITHRDIAVIMKDWILGDGTVQEDPADNPVGQTATEAALLTTLLGGWNEAVATATEAERQALEGRVRDYCGVLLQTPQFMLAGIAPTELGEAPRLRVCLDDGEPCTYRQICESFQSAFTLPFALLCYDDSLEIRMLADPPPLPCLSRKCGWIDVPIEIDCLRDPLSCPRLPDCDLGCATIDCCGGPLPPIDRNGFILDSIAGALVVVAGDVLIKPAGEEKFLDLAPGRTLSAGDTLALPAGSVLELETADGERATPISGVAGRGDDKVWYLMVAAPEATGKAQFESPAIRETLPRAFKARAIEAPWSRYGDAGPPTLSGQYESLDQERINLREDSNRVPDTGPAVRENP